MKIYHTVPSEEVELQKIICDCCKKEFTDIFEIQEFISIEKDTGYGSIFGDDSLLLLDLCQHCVKKLLEPYIKIVYHDDLTH
jgi:hypothetical protein